MKLFSEAWALALTDALNGDEKFRHASRKRKGDVVVFRVTGAPDGEVVHHMLLTEGVAKIGIGEPAGEPTGTITMDFDTAQQMARGELNGQKATMTGKLRTSFSLPKMMSLAPVLDARQKVEKTLGAEA